MRRPRTTITAHRYSTTFRAFYDLLRPGYLTYAVARLPAAEASIAVAHTFGIIASDWSTTVRRPNPAAYAWYLHTHYISRTTGSYISREEEVALMHDVLHLPVHRIATLTGREPAAVAASLGAAHRCGC
jgi:hypothetical protein